MAAAVLLIMAIFPSGCGERENPVEPELAEISLPYTYAYGTSILQSNALRDNPSRDITISTPPGYESGGRPYPVLYLLHDFNHNNLQFEIYKLHRLANQMVLDGEIEPMLIVTANATNRFGGSMYANSAVCGQYEDLMVAELMQEIDESFDTHTRAGRDARAIGGLGFGGQAAIKLAIKHPELFSSASALNAPLAYAGDGETTDGFLGMFKYFFIENGIAPGDLDAYAAVLPSPGTPVTNMLFAMAAAYSPSQDLASLRPWSVGYEVPKTVDTVYFDMPFDHQLYVEQPIWNRWLEHDVKTLLTRNPDALDDTPVYIDVALEDEYGFHLQSAVFVQEMRDLGLVDTVKYQYHTYTGTLGYSADHTALIATRLAELLKFHSAHLAQPGGYTE